MSSLAARTYLTPEEYIALERKATLKSEYLSGEIVAMSGASDTHNLITMNASTALYNQLADRGCRVYASDMRVGISAGISYFYPDIAVTCDKPRFEDDVFDTLINPQVIIEVLSDSTAGYDRGEKFIRYRQLESLQEYIFISQDQVKSITISVKANNGCLANSAHLRMCYRSFQSARNFPYVRFTDSLNLKPMIPFKPPVLFKKGNPISC